MAYVGRRDALRAPPAGARPLSLGADLRPAVRPGRGRRARRPVRLAQRLLRARGACSRWRPPGSSSSFVTNPRTRAAGHPEETSRGFVADYVAVLSNPWARFVILAVFIEASIGWGAFAYVGADLHLRFGLSFTAVGLIVGTFGVGGLIYAATVQQLVNRFGQAGLAIFGGVLLGARLSCARHRRGVVARAARGHRDRARLLRAAQHAADQCHADDAARRAAPRSRSSPRRSISARCWAWRRARCVFDRFTAPCRCSLRPPSHCPCLPGGSASD